MRGTEIFERWGRVSWVVCWQFDSDTKSKFKLTHKQGMIGVSLSCASHAIYREKHS